MPRVVIIVPGPSETQQILQAQKTVLRAVYDIQSDVADVLKKVGSPKLVGRLDVLVKTSTFELEITKMKKLDEGQWFILKLNPKDKNGNPKPVQNAEFRSDNEKLLSKTVNKAGTACLFVAQGESVDEIGYGAKGDADLGEGVVPLEFSDSVVIAPLKANDLGAEVGEAQDGPIPEDF